MGNSSSNSQSSSELKPKSLPQMIDYIATNYILTMNFESLKKLHDKEYCDKLVILTSDIIDKYYTSMDVVYLSQRTKKGENNNIEEINELTKDKLLFYNKDNVDTKDFQNSVKKKRMCVGIAKFYIKIAHLFYFIFYFILFYFIFYFI